MDPLIIVTCFLVLFTAWVIALYGRVRRRLGKAIELNMTLLEASKVHEDEDVKLRKLLVPLVKGKAAAPTFLQESGEFSALLAVTDTKSGENQKRVSTYEVALIYTQLRDDSDMEVQKSRQEVQKARKTIDEALVTVRKIREERDLLQSKGTVLRRQTANLHDSLKKLADVAGEVAQTAGDAKDANHHTAGEPES